MDKKTNYSPVSKLTTFYSNGRILAADDGKYLLCGCSSIINLLDSRKGVVEHSFSHVDDAYFTCFVVSPNGKMLITSNQRSKLRQWDFETKTVKRTWTSGHDCPIASMDFDSTSTLLCTGATDGSVRVWDMDGKCCTNLFRNHSGVVRIVKFNPNNPYELFTTCDSYNIKLWNLQSNECIAVFQGHFSVVTSLQFSSDSEFLYSSSRDKVVIVWGLKDNSKRVVPIYESVESMVVLPGSSDDIKLFSCLPSDKEDHLVVAGPSGKITVWNARKGQCVAKNDSFYDDEPNEENINQVTGFVQIFMLNSLLVGVTGEQNIIFFDPKDLSIRNQFVGNNGSILDLKFLGENHLAMATTANQLKVFNVDNGSYLLSKGHKDTIMCVDVCRADDSAYYIVSGSKDNTVMIWHFDESSSALKHLTSGVAHMHTVNGVCITPVSTNNKQSCSILSCSTDKTLKVWHYSPEDNKLKVVLTTEGHDNEINSVTISPNFQFIATASKDKTAKLWNKSDLNHIGTFKGHKRGVWAVQFSHIHKLLATASNDSTVKIWDIDSFTCLKTLEGHDCGVLRISFISNDLQLVSCGSDGMLKLWTIKSSECIKTFDAHDDKVWAMAVTSTGDKVVTGANDGSFTRWKDVTEQEHQEELVKKQEFMLKEQELMNLLHLKQFSQALELSITLDQPKRTLDIMKELIKQDVDVSKQLSVLSDTLLDTLLGYSVVWNQNSKNCMAAQLVLNHLLKSHQYADILKFKNINKVLEGMIPYTERHFARVKENISKSAFEECLMQTRGLSRNNL